MMTNLKRLDPVMVFLSLVAIIGLASPLSFFLDLGSPFGGFLGVVNPENRGIAVDGSTPPWWSGVGPGLLQTGDILLTINGKAYEYHSIRDAYLAVYRTGNFQAELSFLRGEQILSRSVPLKLFNFEDFYDIVIPDLLNNLCFWLVAFGVFRAKPKEPINRAFAIAAGLVALSQSVVHPSLFVQSTAFARFAVLLWSLISPFVGLSIFYFASVFPFPIRNVYVNRVLKILGLMCVVVSLLFGLSRLLLWFWGYSDFIANVDTLSFRFAMFLLPGGMAFFVLTATFGAIQSQKFRRQLPLLLFGFCIAFLNVLPSVLNSLTPLTLYLVGLDTRPVLVVVPFVFALNILRYKAFRISDPYLIFALMISLSAFLSNVYAWFLWKFPLAGVLERPPFALLLVLVLSLNLFWALQTTLRGFLVKVFNWEGMSLSLVQQYGNRFSGASDFNLLPGMMAQALTEDLKIDQAAIYLWDEEVDKFQFSAIVNGKPDSLPQLLGIPRVPDFIFNQAYHLESGKNSVATWLEPTLNFRFWEIALPLGLYRPVGLILLGTRVDEEHYDERDLSILSLIGQQSTLFLMAAQMTHWLERAQDEERYLIAQDLHDTTQQDLNAIAFHLYNSGRILGDNPEKSAQIMQECLVDIQAAIRQLYEIRRNLDPYELNNELVEPLRRTLERTTRNRNLRTHLTVADNLDEFISARIRRVIYRVVKQSLDNTLAHAEALNFYVSIQKEGDRVTFSISDDGKGATTEQFGDAIATGHMGIKTMRTRVESVGGEFGIVTHSKQGVTIQGQVPWL